MNRQVANWVSYDFANSFLSAALEGLYFSQWIVIDNKFPDIWYGGVFSAATLLLVITAPFLGSWSDTYGKRLPFLKVSSVAMIIAGLFLGVVANSWLLTFNKVILALIAFFLVQYFYQASLTFYNPLLNQLTTAKNRGIISGIGQLFNNLGFVLATGVFLIMTQRNLTLFGSPGRNQVFLPAIILFAVMSLPMLLTFKEQSISQTNSKFSGFKNIYQNTIQGIKHLFTKQKNVGLFLIAFMLISDAILTANLFFAIFMQEVFQIPDGQKFILISLMSILVIPSCYLGGKLGDKFGLKPVLLASCLILIVSFLMISLTATKVMLYPLIVLVGLGWGGYYTTARALLVAISPPKQLGEYFGFYATFQKFASIIGPLTWGGITLALINYGIIRYRVAVIALVILMAAGTALLTRVKEQKTAYAAD